ncbi:MAG: cytochrome b/b6 domain-containing protein [Pseudomonadota bacterium]
MGASAEASVGTASPRWDPVVRLTHWGIAAAVLLNGLITEEGGQIHVWIGYAAFALLALRLVWGFVGTAEARFSAFPPSISAARTHVADLWAARHGSHRSHNPLGALMAYALWGTLAVVTLTGISMAGSPFAPLPDNETMVQPTVYETEDAEGGGEDHDEDDEGDEGDEVLEEVHELAANLLLVLAAIHVVGVAFESKRSGRNLVGPMLKGS